MQPFLKGLFSRMHANIPALTLGISCPVQLLQNHRGSVDFKGQDTKSHLLTLPQEKIDFWRWSWSRSATDLETSHVASQ